MPIAVTPLTSLRRRQLVDLADAYEIPIDRDAPKPHILPALINAQQAGVLDKEPINRGAFRRAQRNSDQEPLPPLPEELEAIPTPGELAKAQRQEQAAQNPLIALRKLCSKRGVKVAGGATIDDMLKILAETTGESSDSAADSEAGSSGQTEGRHEIPAP